MTPNLYARFTESIDGELSISGLIMPNECGELDSPAPTGQGWYAVQWPVNPHFTGETMLLCLLNERIKHREFVGYGEPLTN